MLKKSASVVLACQNSFSHTYQPIEEGARSLLTNRRAGLRFKKRLVIVRGGENERGRGA
jgi:hypothetical protein